MASSWREKLAPSEPGWLAACCILVAAVAVFWSPCLFGRMAPLLGDAQANMLPWRAQSPPPPNARWDALLWDGMAQYYPWRAFAARMARRGQIPLWNPHQFCGAPFLANGQSAFLYPPNWLFFLVPVRYAFGLSAALHYVLAGGLMLLLGRELNLRPAAALVGAIAFAFGGVIVSWTALPTLMNTAAWLPGVAWAIERAYRRRAPFDGLLIGVLLALTLLAGHLQIAIYVWLFALALILVRTIGVLRERATWRAALPMTAALPLGLMLASAQLLPTYELAGLSPRGSATATAEGFEFRRVRALQPEMLITLLSPNALGTPDDWNRQGLAYTEVCGYIGKLTLLLALVGIAAARERRAFTYIVFAALALDGAMGGVVARVLYYRVPGMAQAGGFGRMLCIYTFGVAVFAALGAQWLTERLSPAGARPTLRGRLAPWAGLVAAGLIAADLLVWGRGFLPLSPRERVYPDTALTSQLVEDAGEWRVLAVTRRADWVIQRRPEVVLPPNSACAYGYDSVQGYDSLLPRVYERFASEVSPDGHTPLANGNMVLLDNPSSGALDEAAMKWLVVPGYAPVSDPRLVERSRELGVIVYENRNALSRARLRTEDGALLSAEAEQTGDPCHVVCRLDSWAAGDLVLADTWYPGWHAYVDERPTAIALDPPSFRSVATPEGAERVEIVYAPASFATGLFVSLLALAIAAVCVTCRRGCRSCVPSVDTSGPASSEGP